MTERNRHRKTTEPDDALDAALRELHRQARSDHTDLEDVRIRVLAAAREEAGDGARRRMRLPRPSLRLPSLLSWRWAAVPAAVVAVAMAVVVPLAMFPGEGGVRPAGPQGTLPGPAVPKPASAEDVLLRAADAVAEAPDRVQADSRYREYVSWVVDPAWGVVAGQERMGELTPDGRGNLRDTQTFIGPPEWLGHDPGYPASAAVDGGVQECAPEGVVSAAPCYHDENWYRAGLFAPFAGEEPPLRWLGTALREASGSPWRFEVEDNAQDRFDTAVRVLRTGLAPAPLRAAIYRELAAMPEVELTDVSVTTTTSADDAGEFHGVAVGIEDGERGLRKEIVLDRVTGEFVGAAVVAIEGHDLPDVRPGTVLWSFQFDVTVPTSVTSVCSVGDC
ncbi:hypothetical protein SAXI111661_16970 [Saccharomonospora xinjiangensis]|uniref:hypothetical protein n=1 Tax=Saccharomonospora xinjiangensis TaxID=75294 RepID=UPI00106FFAA3|nr:hypothetical protein [Saccharomonospora xinjiangensis]QBQ62398.1 hypothetical protein EYD13_20320 [Saccharomonospora xinjiangensis]